MSVVSGENFRKAGRVSTVTKSFGRQRKGRLSAKSEDTAMQRETIFSSTRKTGCGIPKQATEVGKALSEVAERKEMDSFNQSYPGKGAFVGKACGWGKVVVQLRKKEFAGRGKGSKRKGETENNKHRLRVGYKENPYMRETRREKRKLAQGKDEGESGKTIRRA